ncbi:di-heme oxidoredictase family protein [Neptunomonas japonica]|uniref:di-heme oxidoreductase family protein n=1 Tax=Neptunomonas japonica TaxID=417574 RepID=UPI00040A5AFF|nr:di-heme oxidoredictase family protein [Neptunomonas japonica]
MKKSFFILVLIGAVAAFTAVTASNLSLFSKAYAAAPLPSTQNASSSQPAVSKHIFSLPQANLTQEERLSFVLGKSLFEKIWVSSPSSTTASDGLGPLYNARSCLSCHIRNGRGQPTNTKNPDHMAASMMMRISIPAQTEQHKADLAAGLIGVVPEPTYGTQLQDSSVQGLLAEGKATIRYNEIPIKLSTEAPSPTEKSAISLRAPEYTIEQLNYGPLPNNIQMSPRIAPPMIGLGLLAAISETDILAKEDPNDIDGDGISGRANRVWDIQQQQTTLGRFGWKAGNPTLLQQNNAALHSDIGISSPMFPSGAGECTAQQTDCQSFTNGNSAHLDNAEASAQMVSLIEFYTRNLAVPKRRNSHTPAVLNGQATFTQIGCQRCHTPRYETPSDVPAAQANQVIWPYTDLLLHDMGEGLADHRPEFQASGREWRTPPLWGVGLTKAVSRHTQFLHDGRARNLYEAILWHGGEAQASKASFMQLPLQDRNNLITFLESL